LLLLIREDTSQISLIFQQAFWKIRSPTAEAEVDADAHDIRRFIEVDRGPAQTDDFRLEADRGIAEIIVRYWKSTDTLEFLHVFSVAWFWSTPGVSSAFHKPPPMPCDTIRPWPADPPGSGRVRVDTT
jgi:hypothetical protein